MSGTWASGWALNDVVSVAEFAKGTGLVADNTLGVAAASIDFTGLPTTYAYLRVLIQGRGDTVAANISINLRFNNDSGNNYASQVLRGNAATASAIESISPQNVAAVGGCPAASATASHAGSCEIVIPNYSAATFFKQWHSATGWSEAQTTAKLFAETRTGVWASTAVINRVTLVPSAGNFLAGTRVSVYAMGS